MAEEDNWTVLVHRPGPAAAGEPVFAHPDFAEHVAFLDRLADRGLLVAAGPLADEPGTGMTIVRAPAGVDVRQLATEDDQSVVRGLLAVEIRDWDVRLSGDR